MVKNLNKFDWLIPLPIILFILGIGLLPYSTNLKPIFKSAGIDIFIHTLFGILASLFLIWRIKKYPTKMLAITHASLTAFFSALVLFLLTDILLSKLIFNDKEYLDHIDNTESIRFVLCWLTFGWLAHIAVTKKHLEENHSQTAFQQHAIVSLKEAELFRLRQQLQPHFLYNSLNSINALIQLDPEAAQEMVGKLSDFLRLSVKRDVNEFINIQEELEYIESYLAIESVRFGNRLIIEINKNGEQWEEVQIPAFILQPVLENAIKFGLYGNVGSVLIKIDLVLRKSILNIEISNPFDEITQPPRGTGFGLEGVSRRLTLLYGRGGLLEIKKEKNIFSTIVKIPQ